MFIISLLTKISNEMKARSAFRRSIFFLVTSFVTVLIGPMVGLRADAQPYRAPYRAPYHAEETRYAMGCLYSIEAWGDDRARLQSAVTAALDEVDRLDQLLSHYKPSSDLSRLNREAWPGPAHPVPELFDLISRSLEFSRASSGAFDVTVGPLMRAWGFFRGEGRFPTDSELQAAMKTVGYHHIRLDRQARTVSFDRSGVELDLGGIGKGYAVDRAGKILRQAGVRSALISAGGSSILAVGRPPGQRAWSVRLQDPLEPGKTALRLQLRDEALSVSGSAEKFFELNGRRYGHIMDPRTGHPVGSVLSVAVISKAGVDGDALDNAFFVLGPAGSRNLRRRYAVREVVFQLPNGRGGWRMVRR